MVKLDSLAVYWNTNTQLFLGQSKQVILVNTSDHEYKMLKSSYNFIDVPAVKSITFL